MEITAELIKKLREQTHAGIMDCKKALIKSEGNFDEAEKYLKEMGLAAVAKRVDRATDNGRITMLVDKNKAVMIEVTCETDFVAKNKEFAKLGEDLCHKIIDNGYTEVQPDMVEMVNGLIATINENMKIKRMVVLNIPENGFVQTYNHSDGNIGVLLQFVATDKAIYATEAFKDFAFKAAMHVCAGSPMFLTDANVPKSYEDEQLEIFRAQVASMDKPEKVLQGIVRGKLNKLYAEICLMDQIFLINNDEGLSVKQLLAKFNKENGSDLSIVGYERFRAGSEA